MKRVIKDTMVTGSAGLVVLLVILVVFGIMTGHREHGLVKRQVSCFIDRDNLRRITPSLIDKFGLTINPELQGYIKDIVGRYRVRFSAICVLDGSNGDILALYGNVGDREDCTLALNTYLAASLFKIITSIAAIEYANLNPGSVFTYNGKAHTLYKSQIDHHKNRWTRVTTLANAFALSNNVVFAKIGLTRLGAGPLLLTAMKLGFWQSPLVECGCEASTMLVPENNYNIAELASGFNRYTRISPVHAAQIATGPLNQGSMIRPRLLKDLPVESTQVMDTRTAKYLADMMRQTVSRGTVSSAFRRYRSGGILRRLVIGAKSGTIDGKDPDGRRNWFVGYAKDRRTRKEISLACLVIIDDYYWIEANDLARMIIRYYFSRV